MTKEPKTNWSSFTKAELIRTIKALDKRQTALLNQIAKLQRTAGESTLSDVPASCGLASTSPPSFPWSTGSKLANPFEDVK